MKNIEQEFARLDLISTTSDIRSNVVHYADIVVEIIIL